MELLELGDKEFAYMKEMSKLARDLSAEEFMQVLETPSTESVPIMLKMFRGWTATDTLWTAAGRSKKPNEKTGQKFFVDPILDALFGTAKLDLNL